jgi:hypothetical protein
MTMAVLLLAASAHAQDEQGWKSTGYITGLNGVCLDDRAGSTADQNAIQVYECNGGMNQSWVLHPNGTITGIDGKCLVIGRPRAS